MVIKGGKPWNTGKKLTPEHRAKIGKGGKGRVMAPKSREKLSKSIMGHPVSLETRAKLSAQAKVISTKHGKCGSQEYIAWQLLRQRCNNPKNPRYNRYGGRGISVCERWSRFENFYADMGDKPDPKLSIDRIDNDGNYEPGNCRWATASEQRRNSHRDD